MKLKSARAGVGLKWWLPLGVVVVDQAVKWWWEVGGKERQINQGVALGAFPSDVWIILVAGLVVYLWLKKRGEASWGWWLMVGGGLANLVDRIFRGGVMDMFELPLVPTFNLADVAIVGGVLWLIVSRR